MVSFACLLKAFIMTQSCKLVIIWICSPCLCQFSLRSLWKSFEWTTKKNHNEGRFRTKLHDKRNDYSFPNVNFIILCNNIPEAAAFGVYTYISSSWYDIPGFSFPIMISLRKDRCSISNVHSESYKWWKWKNSIDYFKFILQKPTGVDSYAMSALQVTTICSNVVTSIQSSFSWIWPTKSDLFFDLILHEQHDEHLRSHPVYVGVRVRSLVFHVV